MALIICFLSALLVWQILANKLYKSSIVLIYWLILNTFLSPTVYYSFLNGTSYKKFSSESYKLYLLVGIIYLTSILLINYFVIFSRKGIILSAKLPKLKNVSAFFLIVVFSFVSGYTFIYRSGFPLLNVLSGHHVMEALSRPDVSGSLPHYFIVQTFSTAILPMLYLYFREKYQIKGLKRYILFAIVIFYLIVGGNKGLLLYFFIFIWLYIWGFKIDKRIIIAAVFSIYIYELIVNGGFNRNMSLLEILASPVRRFFVTQGAMLINRIELLSQGFIFDTGNISREVFTYVYGVSGGSAPTYYLGDMVVHLGIGLGLVVSIFVFVVLAFIAKNIDNNPNKNLYDIWAIYYMLYVLGNSSIGMNFWIRMIIICCSLVIIKMDIVQEGN